MYIETPRLQQFQTLSLFFGHSDIQTNSIKLVEASNLSNIPSKYYKFTNIFNKTKAEVLSSYYPYDLKINLEEDA